VRSGYAYASSMRNIFRGSRNHEYFETRGPVSDKLKILGVHAPWSVLHAGIVTLNIRIAQI
jgi:hypothetical protein